MLLSIGDVVKIDGRMFVLTTRSQKTPKVIDRSVDGAGIDALMRENPDFRFVELGGGEN